MNSLPSVRTPSTSNNNNLIFWARALALGIAAILASSDVDHIQRHPASNHHHESSLSAINLLFSCGRRCSYADSSCGARCLIHVESAFCIWQLRCFQYSRIKCDDSWNFLYTNYVLPADKKS